MSSNSSTLFDQADLWPDEHDAVHDARIQADEFGIEPVSPSAAGVLTFLASIIKAKTVIEIGTGTGVSGAALLNGMDPDGTLTTIDLEAEYQRYAKEVYTSLGEDKPRSRLIAGRALSVLPRMSDAAYDMVFVDSDRGEYPPIMEEATRLLRDGGLLIFAGVGADGILIDTSRRDPDGEAVRRMADDLRTDERWVTTLLVERPGLLVGLYNGFGG